MARIKYETAQAFLNHKPHKDASAFRSTGSELYSYNMLLAYWDRLSDDTVVFNYKRKDDGGHAPSITTSAHMSALEQVIPLKNPGWRYSKHIT